jgi:hypothetical protein
VSELDEALEQWRRALAEDAPGVELKTAADFDIDFLAYRFAVRGESAGNGKVYQVYSMFAWERLPVPDVVMARQAKQAVACIRRWASEIPKRRIQRRLEKARRRML